MTESQRRAAADAFEAYNAMEATKRRHFEYLSLLEKAHKDYSRAPSEREQALLAQLLRDHDEQVKVFAGCSAALRTNDEAAFDALWTYIGEVNKALGVRRAH